MTVSEPTGNAVVFSVQVPPDRVQVPSDVLLPTLKLTVPVGVPDVAVTVAFSATDWPDVDELGVAVTVVVVLTELDVTVTVTAVEVDAG